MLKSTQEVNSTDSPGAVSQSLRALFEAEEPKLLRFAFSLVGRREVAEEIVQEVFLQLHVHWDTVDMPQAWLVRSVRNRALNYLRKSKREFWLREGQTPALADGNAETPPVLLERLETVAELRRLVQDLPEGDRRLIELRYYQGLKYREISTLVGITVSNVGFRLHRLMQQLARCMQTRAVADESEAGES